MYNTLKGIKNTKAQYELIQFINSLLPSRIDEKQLMILNVCAMSRSILMK